MLTQLQNSADGWHVARTLLLGADLLEDQNLRTSVKFYAAHVLHVKLKNGHSGVDHSATQQLILQ